MHHSFLLIVSLFVLNRIHAAIPVQKTFGSPRILSIPLKCRSHINVTVCKDNEDRYYFDVNTRTCSKGCSNNRISSIMNETDGNNQFFTKEVCEEQCIPMEIKSIENMSEQAFATKNLGAAVDGEAPDGSDVRLLLSLARGSMAHFSLEPGEGEMWRKQSDREAFVMVRSGTCITIPVGTQFQFRAFGNEPLTAVGITMPPWPGDSEAMFRIGVWNASLVSTWIKPTSTAAAPVVYHWLILVSVYFMYEW